MRRSIPELIILAPILLFLGFGVCGAAEIRPLFTRADLTVIGVTGEFHLGDEERFKQVAGNVRRGIVLFGSDGGNVISALTIGEYIRARGFGTAVIKDYDCASACALAWLAGQPRMMGPEARVGFHGAFVVRDGVATESGPGNALVGAYLNRLGIDDRAIVELTNASPEGMQWLTRADADSIGIPVSLILDDQTNRAAPLVPSRVAEDEAIDRLTGSADAELQGLYSRAPGPLTERAPTPLGGDLAEFASGRVNFSCEVSCSFGWGVVKARAAQLFANGQWADLARLVIDHKYGQDLSFYYLGITAYKLGYSSAAVTYPNTAYFYTTKTAFRCGFLFNQCAGHRFPDDEVAQISFIQQQSINRPTPVESQISPDRVVVRNYVACVWKASNELDDGKSDATTIALAAEPQCQVQMRAIRDSIEGKWNAESRHAIDPQLDAETTKLIVQIVLTQRKMPTG